MATTSLYVGGNVTSYVYGDAGNDTIYLSYGAHPTYARGGTGNDTYIITNALSQIEEFAGEGIDTIRTTVTMSLQAGEMVNPYSVPLISGEVESLVMISNDKTVSRTKCNTLLRCRHGLTLPPTLRRRTRLHHADDPPGA